MALFDPAVKKLLKKEGGYVFDPDDKGGETKYGISKANYPSEDIKNVTVERAIFLYRRDYWDRLHLSEISDQNLAELMLDTAANMGAGTAGLYLKRAARSLGASVPTSTLDSNTIKIVNRLNSSGLAKEIVSKRIDFYKKEAVKDPSQKKFLAGWVFRMKEYAPTGIGVAGFLLAAIGFYILSKRGAA